jgi:hypothetical protein
MDTLKKCLPDVLAVLLFAVIAFAYFFPADTEGRILYQHDTSAGRGAGQEATEYYQRHDGERTRWTNSTFSGMPTYQTSPSYSSTDKLQTAVKAYHLWLPENVWYVFVYLLGFYILLRAFNFRQALAVLGSIIWAFSSYFFIIIAAGHIWKVWALAYLPPLIAGMVLAYRGKYLWGMAVLALFTAFEINANHVQMTYYYLFPIFFMLIAFFVQAMREKRLAHFAKATAVCIVGALIGICMNLSNLYHTWQYSQESMRGKSELVKADAANQSASGLDRDYITQWSYGISETWTLLVPNAKGGTSQAALASNETGMKKANPEFYPIYQQIGQYWGEQPGTSGPVYVGAFVLTLFFLGLFIVKGPMKWALLAATILSIMLAWGKNFMGLTDFFIDHFPMYAKFRTVASILVIAEFTIPLLAMMALKEVFDHPEVLKEKAKALYLSVALTGGIALLFALAPGLFFSDFVSSNELQALSQFPPEQLNPLLSNLTEVRQAIFSADCWRTVIVIALGTALLLLYRAQKLKALPTIGGIALLCLVDMWMVNKRYLNDDMFVGKSVREQPQPMTDTDRMILEDKTLDYRVLNFATNTFNENETSFYHKSIGGYHAAKLRRYQDLIEQYIAPEMEKTMPAVVAAQGDMTQVKGDSIFPIINMLNARYFIFPLQGGQTAPLLNTQAMGNAWMVDSLVYVNNANEELDAIGKVDLHHVAVVDNRFKTSLGEAVKQDSLSTVTLSSYEPNDLKYEVKTGKGGIVVFSEIYYPGWKAEVDGKPVDVSRVNYVLRAIRVEPGTHQVRLSFFPESVDKTETVANIAMVLLLLALLACLFFALKKKGVVGKAQSDDE